MTKLTPNVDTYRVIAETLQLLRETTRTILRHVYDDDWEEKAIHQPLRGFLEQRRSREATIQWRLPDSLDLLDFAGFENLGDIIGASPQLLHAFSVVSSDADLLRARFLELDSIQSRVAYARPVSDVEMEFVVSLAERLRNVATDAGALSALPEGEGEAPAAQPPANGEGPELDSETVAVEPEKEKQEPAPATPAKPIKSAANGKGGKLAGGVPHVSHRDLKRALEAGESSTILTALYAEVTRLAEALWSEAAALPPTAWEAVRESTWYDESFTGLGLRPLSDFYDLHATARDRLAAGVSRSELHELLQERRFGEVLMALRELFRKHLV